MLSLSLLASPRGEQQQIEAESAPCAWPPLQHPQALRVVPAHLDPAAEMRSCFCFLLNLQGCCRLRRPLCFLLVLVGFGLEFRDKSVEPRNELILDRRLDLGRPDNAPASASAAAAPPAAVDFGIPNGGAAVPV